MIAASTHGSSASDIARRRDTHALHPEALWSVNASGGDIEPGHYTQGHMTTHHRPNTLRAMGSASTGGPYEIVVGATLASDWSGWFDDFDVEAHGDKTLLVGTVEDQAALHGVLARLRDLGLPILAVHRVG